MTLSEILLEVRNLRPRIASRLTSGPPRSHSFSYTKLTTLALVR
jgi:hypothetical protein